ncbi:hypothetical protein LX16_4990 [Stackebrandtia albiflava]|uniref:Uncharacterized protein n=1 Tax=Stackebrandtia albiflava TaxID=406432 RepID=A0A562UPG8_9ACTN|nr:hypothetical protein [Stackebrandtia albiflava]TWJ07507.1 hypothetical protein LX16_4990 [Stackebrandtia albiflava]
MSTSSRYDSDDWSGRSQGFDEPVEAADTDDDYIDEETLWTPAQKALPPVFGRYDKDSGERLMHYSDDVIQSANKDDDFDWQDSEGTSIDIGF